MSSDSQNSKQDFHGNVVPIRSGEEGTETERKLAAARRLFSLHEYRLCEQVVQEVLAIDPHNSKAKALLELTSIKLSKRKLYKKMVDPQQPSTLPLTPPQIEPIGFDVDKDPSPRTGASNRNPDFRRPTETGPHKGTQPPLAHSSRIPVRVKPELASENPFSSSTDSIRERTIAAMVDLLKDPKKGLGEWKDTRYDPGTHEPARDRTEAPLSKPEKTSLSARTLHDLIPGPSTQPRIISVKEEIPIPRERVEKVPQSRQQEKSNPQVDFLPGSLADLFETTEDLSAEQLAEPDIKAKGIEIVPLPVQSTPKELPVSPAKLLESTGDLQNEPLQKQETTLQPIEVAPIPVHTIPDESPVAHHRPNAPLSPPPIHPVVPANEKKTSPKTEPIPQGFTHLPNVQGLATPAPPLSQERKQRTVLLPDVKVFDRITPTRETPPHEFIDRKLEQRSEEIRNSEIKAVSIAQIKKYLYQEQYDLCSQELERIRGLFPQNAEIQAFVENTSRRLIDLKAMKKFEGQAKELMRSAVTSYQEGKFPEALAAAQQVLQVNPNHTQARELVEFVQRRIDPTRKKELEAILERYCRTCGTSVDSSSQFCHHCGKRLS